MQNPPPAQRIPECCSPLDWNWPLAGMFESVAMSSCVFDIARFRHTDFALQQIDVPNSIRRSVTKRQAEFLAGRLCARDALRQLGGTWTTPSMNEDGSPRWPPGFTGSITHSAGRAMAVVADTCHWKSLGVDMECVIPDAQSSALAGKILGPTERRCLETTLSGEQLALIFSLKESLFKALYPLTRTRFYFHDAEVLISAEPGRARLRLRCDLSAEWHRGDEFEARFCRTQDRLLSIVAI